jgi:hypothetical protein
MAETTADRLSERVLREIARLGGEVAPPPTERQEALVRTVLGTYPLPEPIRQFLRDARWPKGKNWLGMAYRSKSDEYPRGVQFVGGDIEEDYGCCGDHPYTQIAMDASQFLHVVPLDCTDPSDPPVYRVDHEGQDRLPWPQSLSEFLADLEPEG